MAITVTTSIIPTQAQVPLDVRTVIESLQDIDSISNPYKGLIFYSKSQDAFYKVAQTQQKKIGFSTIHVVKFYQKMPDNSIFTLVESLQKSLQDVTSDIQKISQDIKSVQKNQIIIEPIQEV